MMRLGSHTKPSGFHVGFVVNRSTHCLGNFGLHFWHFGYDFSVICVECVAMPCCLEDHLPFLVFMENGLPLAFGARRG